MSNWLHAPYFFFFFFQFDRRRIKFQSEKFDDYKVHVYEDNTVGLGPTYTLSGNFIRAGVWKVPSPLQVHLIRKMPAGRDNNKVGVSVIRACDRRIKHGAVIGWELACRVGGGVPRYAF